MCNLLTAWCQFHCRNIKSVIKNFICLRVFSVLFNSLVFIISTIWISKAIVRLQCHMRTFKRWYSCSATGIKCAQMPSQSGVSIPLLCDSHSHLKTNSYILPLFGQGETVSESCDVQNKSVRFANAVVLKETELSYGRVPGDWVQLQWAPAQFNPCLYK